MCSRKLRVVLFFAIKSANVVHLKYRGPRNINLLCSKWQTCVWRDSWVILPNQNTQLVLQQCHNYLQNKLHFFVGCFTVALQTIPKFANVILVSIDFHVKFDDFFYVCLVSFLFRWFVSARSKAKNHRNLILQISKGTLFCQCWLEKPCDVQNGCQWRFGREDKGAIWRQV